MEMVLAMLFVLTIVALVLGSFMVIAAILVAPQRSNYYAGRFRLSPLRGSLVIVAKEKGKWTNIVSVKNHAIVDGGWHFDHIIPEYRCFVECDMTTEQEWVKEATDIAFDIAFNHADYTNVSVHYETTSGRTLIWKDGCFAR